MEPQHEPMVIGQPAMQRIVQLLAGCLDPAVRKIGQFPGVCDAVEHRLDHPPAAETHDIGDYRIELDVGLF
jgi:hypothetical protein